MPFLHADQVEHFQSEGYLVVEDLISLEDVLDPLVDEYEKVLSKLAEELFHIHQPRDPKHPLTKSDPQQPNTPLIENVPLDQHGEMASKSSLIRVNLRNLKIKATQI
jgi:hypothetical protein